MLTDQTRRIAARATSRWGRVAVLVACTLLGAWRATVPVRAATAGASPSPVTTPSPTPTCPAPPCADPAAAHLALAVSADRATAAVGDTVHYTVTLSNTGSLPATSVTVDDVMGGDAGYVVDDGTLGSANSFVGQPVTTVTRVLAGHYSWSYAVVDPGDSDVVRFGAVLTAPRGSIPSPPRVITLTSTASTPGVPSVTATTTASFGVAATPGGTRGARTVVPATGSAVARHSRRVPLLGGLGVLLLGMHVRRRDARPLLGGAPRDDQDRLARAPWRGSGSSRRRPRRRAGPPARRAPGCRRGGSSALLVCCTAVVPSSNTAVSRSTNVLAARSCTVSMSRRWRRSESRELSTTSQLLILPSTWSGRRRISTTRGAPRRSDRASRRRTGTC